MTDNAESGNQGKAVPIRTVWWQTLLVITFPAWGAVLVVAFLSLLPRSADVGSLPLLAALIAPMIGVIPLLSIGDIPIFIKVFIVLPMYYLFSLFVSFVVGWSALCVFQSSCH